MGGNAFEVTVRLTAAEHDRVKRSVMEAVMQDASMADMVTVVASAEVLDKDSFGDVDLYAAPRGGNCVETDVDHVRGRMTKLVEQVLQCCVPPKWNGSTVSLLSVERYQVDVAFTDSDKLAIYAAVHSNGDFGRFLQISLRAVGLRLTTNGFFLHDERRVGPGCELSKQDASLLLSLDPGRVSAFLGLPVQAFDGRTSLSTEEMFAFVVSSRFFDGAAMTAWVCEERSGKKKSSQRRPMQREWDEWWTAVGRARYGDRKPDAECGSYEEVCELAVEFFSKRVEFRQWKAMMEQKVAYVERAKEYKSVLNSGIVKGWLPDLSNIQVGEVMRNIRAEHGQSGSVELINWVRGMSPENMRSEVFAVARKLEMR